MNELTPLRRLGRGRHSEVWLVQNPAFSLFALKQVSADVSSSTEVEVLRQVEHPHIVQYYSDLTDNGQTYILMEYAEGGDLGKRLKTLKGSHKMVPEKQVWQWVLQIALGLGCIHDKNVIHRDIKPQNLLLTKTGVVKISDFGHAFLLNSSNEFALSGVGTSYYLAPELCKGQPYNHKADIWSFGCVLYELCALHRPFEGENLPSIANKIAHQEPQRLSQTYSEELRLLIEGMLSKQPTARPSIAEIMQAATTKTKKPFQREISIKIPRNSQPDSDTSVSVPTSKGETQKKTPSTTREGHSFNFSDSLLRECPSSPARPSLMANFLVKKVGNSAFQHLKRLFANSREPAKLLLEEPWIVAGICGQQNLTLIEAGLSFGVFAP